MAVRANWKGVLKVGEVSCPVALYTAASTAERIAFHILNRKTGHRVHREFVDAETGERVEAKEQVKGYETGPGDYIPIEVATEQGFPVYGAVGTVNRGWVMVGNGDVAEGVALLRSGSAAYRATGTEMWTTHFLALQAKACEIAGKIEEGLTLLDDALQDLERTGMRWLAAELNRHKGQLLLRQGHSQAAEELYSKALSIAREQEAKLWELRAATSLARLRRDQGRHAEARDRHCQVEAF